MIKSKLGWMTEVTSLLREHLILSLWKVFNPISGIWTCKPGLLEQPNEYHPNARWQGEVEIMLKERKFVSHDSRMHHSEQ